MRIDTFSFLSLLGASVLCLIFGGLIRQPLLHELAFILAAVGFIHFLVFQTHRVMNGKS
ncbi:MAG: hypothetical protein ACRC5C_10085 [Bacilli bacterium]